MRSNEKRPGNRTEGKAQYVNLLTQPIRLGRRWMLSGNKKFFADAQRTVRRRLRDVYTTKGNLIEE